RESGFRRILFINGHGGNEAALHLLVDEIVLDLDVVIGGFSYWDIPVDTSGSDSNRVPSGHAGLDETSLMLYIRPDLVKNIAPPTNLRIPLFEAMSDKGIHANRSNE